MLAPIGDADLRRQRPRWYLLPLSILAHAALIVLLLIFPLLTIILPEPPRILTYVEAFSIPPTPPAGTGRVSRTTHATGAAASRPAPTEAPSGISEEAPPDTGEPGGSGGSFEIGPGVPGGLTDSSDANLRTLTPPPVSPGTPVRIGGQIKDPRKVVDVKPVYPRLALVGHVQGRVMIEATIGLTGEVEHARIVRSVPLLDEAALTAVRQWKFTPTLLNGVPVAVIMTVTVDFRLQ